MEKELIKYAIEPLKIKIESTDFHSSHLWRKAHLHDAVEIVYINSGEVCVYINNEEIFMKSGDIILINRNIMHYIENLNSASITYTQFEMREYFNLSYDTDLYSFISRNNILPYYFSQEKSELKEIFFALKKEMKEKRAYYELYIKSYIGLLVPFMLRNNLIADYGRETTKKTEIFLPLAEYIEKNYTQPISLDDCCGKISMTKFELCHKFKHATGRTVTEYINYVRINHAKHFLQKNTNSTETAFLCGFSSVQYFNRTFKKYTGYTPGEYKKQKFQIV